MSIVIVRIEDTFIDKMTNKKQQLCRGQNCCFYFEDNFWLVLIYDFAVFQGEIKQHSD